ncbi:MFS transporter [Dictyobacter aurantiacus]|uniref:Putative transporter n=1 Tax=Dictyobacter aurantiacus TaxID=1936993 RepID=A0A401ZKK2_9CHLR|nr:MFS transporter [Dictyobacter aurantiacus]GCE07385.1 putative transporter [Dictyobacter aurantiacus]
MGQAITGATRYPRALQSRPFALLWLGQAISALGDGTFYIALSWQVLVLTGSGTAIAGVLVAGTIPRILFFLIGGVAADRLPRRLVLLYSDTVRAVIVLVIALLGWAHLLQMWHLVALALLFGVVDGFFNPAYQAIIPQLVEKDALASANSLTGISQKVGLILGSALAAGSITLFSNPASAFAFNGATFVFSALCIILLRLPERANRAMVEQPHVAVPTELENVAGEQEGMAVPTAQESAAPAAPTGMMGHMRSLFKDAGEGFRYVLQSPWLRIIIPISALCNIVVSGPSQVASPKLVHDSYAAGAWLLGTLVMANSIGATVAMLLVGQMPPKRQRGIALFIGLIGLSVAMVVFGLPLPHSWEPIVATLAALLGGGCLGFFSIIWITLLQEKVPGDKLGRVSSIDMLGSFALLPVGYALVGVLTDLLGASMVFFAGGVLCFVLCLIALSSKSVRELQ